MKADFLLELLSEEIPARMQPKAVVDLGRLFEAEMAAVGLRAKRIETFATPRRLALIARGLPIETEAVSEEIKGPRASAPRQALEGFLRKTGLTREQLVERDGVLFALVDRTGRATGSVLAEAVPAIVRAFPWPKAMRWGEASLVTDSPRWVRPLQGIVALLGEEIVEFEIAGVKSSAATVGHRFHHPGIITIGGAHDYAEKLRACHVILDPAERRRIIAEGANGVAKGAGLILVEDEGLLAENVGLTEWPVPLLGGFDPNFLDVPREVIQLTMRTNQKYFACLDQEGRLAPHFVCIANVEASDGGKAIVEGNRKVLAARLADARYFWEQDLKVPLRDQAKKLDQIVFHEKLGTIADKINRVAMLARWLVEEGIVKGANPDQVETAVRLAKADIVTGLVGEFPELQGIVGGYVARAQGQPHKVADAVRDHYKPVGQGDEVPTAPVSVAVSLADKLDTLVSYFALGEMPTGSRDPFALRRSGLGAIRLILTNNVRVQLGSALQMPVNRVAAFQIVRDHTTLQSDLALSLAKTSKDPNDVAAVLAQRAASIIVESPFLDETARIIRNAYIGLGHLLAFFADRLKVQQREAGVRHDLIDAVFALEGEDDLVRLLARVKALQGFVETAEGADLLTGYKRAANILKRENWEAHGTEKKQLSYTPEKEEAALIAALDAEEPKAQTAIAAEDFEGAMAALASLRGPLDSFFEKVTVNDADSTKREARLNLLARMRDVFHRVADFSQIEG